MYKYNIVDCKMEAQPMPDDLYGNSLRLVIPRLEIKNLNIKNSLSPSCFSLIEPLTLSPPQSEETDRGDELNAVLKTHPQLLLNVQANEVIILMINSFVDFFIQYYQYYHVYKVELNPLILKVKEIIFYSTNQNEMASASDYNELIGLIKSKLDLSMWPDWEEPKSYFFPKNAGREFLHDPDYNQRLNTRLETLTEALLHSTTDSHRMQLQEEMDKIKLYLKLHLDDELFIIFARKFQKFEIFSLLFLSYHILSISGFFFTVEIKDFDEILLQELERTPSSSFILQFLPHDRAVINIIKSNLLHFFMKNSETYVMPALRELRQTATEGNLELKGLLRVADTGGSKRFHNNKFRSRKNKYKYNKYKKSRKNKRHRRKKNTIKTK